MKTAIAAGSLAIALSILPSLPVSAQPAPVACRPLIPEIEKARKKGTWTELNHDQWAYLRGIYSMNPQTPPGLPMGDAAAMVQREGNDAAVIVFIDGESACTPMTIPKILVDLLSDVAAGKINHQGDPL